jgi:ATP-dependent Lon protease
VVENFDAGPEKDATGPASEAPATRPSEESGGARPGSGEALPRVLPVLPLNDVVLFPGMIAPLVVTTARSAKLIDDVVAGNRMMICVLQKNRNAEDDKVALGDLHDVGCVSRLLKLLKFPDDTVRILVQGLARCKVLVPQGSDTYLKARYSVLNDEIDDSIQLTALARNASQRFQEIITLSPMLPDELKVAVVNIEDPGRLSDLIAANLNMGLEERQELLEEYRPRARLKKLTPLLNREREVLRVGNELQSQVSETIAKNQREYVLREQMKAIKKELGEQDQQQTEIREIEEKIAKAKMPADVEQIAVKEKDRLASIPVASPEYAVSRTYLELLTDLPWAATTRDQLDIGRARRILDEDHYDLTKVKDRILEFLSVLKLKKDLKGPILCFVGPPGVGKTSLGQSIARSLGRKFIRVSLGGMRDEAEIRGHRRTYIGAMPGRIIQNLRKAGTRNPVFMLDEIDKLGMDFRGDPAAALLEVLDPAQNNTFTDHYLDAPFDLSSVLFIGTANVMDPIPPALRDRMEVIELPGYTLHEKVNIARKYLIPKQLDAHGLTSRHLKFSPRAIEGIITDYTREAGVRNLDRELAAICRKTARAVAEGRRGRGEIAPGRLVELLGAVRFESEVAETRVEPGVATGLAWTPTGGDILFIEAMRMPGKGNLILTGSLGDVMKESARAALSFVKAHAALWKLPREVTEESDFHIHVPAGAIPKDGPSAGLAMLAALYSLVLGKPIRPDVAMTGEITLRGKVMPVGGIKEKILAANRAGIQRVVLPAKNKPNLEEIPGEIRKKMQFDFVEDAGEALLRLMGARQPGKGR